MKQKQPRFDIRRPVRLKQPVTGEQIAGALKKVAEELRSKYVEIDIRETDGEKSAVIGLSSSAPDGDVLIRSGESLEETRVCFNSTYENIGVGSVHWSGVKFNWNTYESGYIRNVETVKRELEILL